MSIRGITFDNQLVKSDDDARLHNMLLSGNCGVIKGCETTYDASHIYVATGQFIILGRQIEVQGTEIITPETVTEGSTYCRLVFEIDLTKTNTAEVFNQGYFKILSSHVKYPDITQEDLTTGGTLYQYLWAEFSQTVDGIGELDAKTKKLSFVADEIEEDGELPVKSAAIYNALNDKATVEHSHPVSEIYDFPEEMPPSEHSHPVSEIYDFPAEMPPSEHSHPVSEIYDFPAEMPPSEHDQSASTITAGTFKGTVKAQASTDYTTAEIRNIVVVSTEPTEGATSPYPNGTITFVEKG